MDEPGLKVAAAFSDEPLISEVGMVFAPLILRAQVLTAKEFSKEIGEVFGPSAIVNPHYSQADIRRLSESLATQGKQIDAKSLAGLTPKGAVIQPGGQLINQGKTITVNRVKIGDMGVTANVAGTSDDCKYAIQRTVEVFDKVSGDEHGWDFYLAKLDFTKYGTTTVSQFPGNLRDMLSPAANKMLNDDIEGNLARKMAPVRAGVERQEVAFARVMIHELRGWVTIVEQNGTMNQCRLDLVYQDDEDIASRRMHVISELEYDSHQQLVEAITGAMAGKPGVE